VIKSYVGQPLDEVTELLFTSPPGEDGAAYAQALLRVLNGVSEPGAIKLCLALLDDLVQVEDASQEARVGMLKNQESRDGDAKNGDGGDAAGESPAAAASAGSPWYTSLLRYLGQQDTMTVTLAGRQLAVALRYYSEAEDRDCMVQYVAWLMNRLGGGPIDGALWSVMLGMGGAALRAHLRAEDAIPNLARLIVARDANDSQSLYSMCFCLWAFTLVIKGGEGDLDSFGALVAKQGPGAGQNTVAVLCELLAMPRREKVVRVVISALRNLVGRNDFCQTMLDQNLLQTLKRMTDKHWSDEDVLEDIEKVKDHLARRFKVLTSYERCVWWLGFGG
jgi:hypothetical protein